MPGTRSVCRYIYNKTPFYTAETPLLQRDLKKSILFNNYCYCGVDKKAVILQPIKNALFYTLKTAVFLRKRIIKVYFKAKK